MGQQTGGTTLFGLLAATAWGGGDFGGSMAVKRAGATMQTSLAVVVIGHLCSLTVLALVAYRLGSPLPSTTAALWGVSGGMVSGVSLIAFYFALAEGHMGSAAAVSGLLCAAVPAIVAQLTEGWARWPQLLGFALAAAAIWFIASATDAVGASRRTAGLAALSGAGFGVYFVALRQAGLSGVLWPTACARVGSAGICVVLLLVLALRHRMTQKSEAIFVHLDRTTLRWILGGATLDLLGNLCFMQATRLGRLDVAAVLASIYPAGTILLAAAVLKEKTTTRQRWGMALALPAVVLITL